MPTCPFHGIEMKSVFRTIEKQEREREAKAEAVWWPTEKVLVEHYACPLCAIRVEARFRIIGERRR